MLHHTYESVSVALRDFLRLESASGILLVIAGVAAMLVANSPLLDLYQSLLQTPIKVQVGSLLFDKPLLLWVNDGWMVVFFLLVGLEIKREVLDGGLSPRTQPTLPESRRWAAWWYPRSIYACINWG